ncbi:hypothetical protein EMIHUDRAFT_198344 [Emiliania huxleyi CCMP1516]|uniref:Tubby C-terminal domain-containing protein n=2 Tax=Emiliania huxleyi TaxID=2903 RepID=A0A0D3I741_EMIH1|nr:hypothetical protein EMIHUDRAFT_198344 [Emiliania huxleyi CCMP1516]EOD07076.1 hypothetical protein EMIHUDRAFT_198344 [Emiliania huxleyi CCMP1516]|eukprot:XP_005759505.1 hypothetical protein EMIHUDRAFT_198344 [Emiliania huxleyi CCMP1516]
MFLKSSELDGNNGDPVDSISDDQVVPFSATSPRRNILSRDSSPDLSRSPQYQERLNRARSQKAMSFRKTTTAGSNARMVTANSLEKSSVHRGASATPIVALEQEIEEMEIEEEQLSQDARRKAELAAATKAKQQRQEYRFEEDTGAMDDSVAPTSEAEGGKAQLAVRPVASYVPAVIDTSDLRAFLMRPGPSGAMVQCYIQRRKTGMARLFPTYELYLKEGDKFLMAARKRKKNKAALYAVGTEFTLYDKGSNPDKVEGTDLVMARQEMACVLYKQNVLGARGPRKMKVMVPDVDEDGERAADESMLERYKSAQDDDEVQVLKNKPPKWNDQVGAYVLNFNGRVTRASVKNFQLYNPSKDPEAVLMQFGRVGKDAFTMDFQHPLCALQAFGIALSSFDYKIACEWCAAHTPLPGTAGLRFDTLPLRRCVQMNL